jgi:hypothetical protein
MTQAVKLAARITGGNRNLLYKHEAARPIDQHD